MLRSIIGLVIGGICGLGMGYFVGFFKTSAYGPPTGNDVRDLMLGAFLSGMGALAGAIVGAVGDVLAFLRRVYCDGSRVTLEADDRELGRSGRPVRTGLADHGETN
jgi:hypothetical protein